MSDWRISALRGHVSLALEMRGLAVLAALIVALAVLLLTSVAFGTIDLDLAETFHALIGASTGRAAMIAGELRLPRALTALMAGGLLGVSGACCRVRHAIRWLTRRSSGLAKERGLPFSG